MKPTITFLLACICAINAFSQSPKYVESMKKAIAEFATDSTDEQLLSLANKFERIALAEKTEWLPYYYAALTRTYVAFSTKHTDKVDGILDVAQKYAGIADSLQPNNSEIYVLKGMVLSGRIMVDPMNRGMQYGMQSGALMNRAVELDPSNPRAYLMIGQGLFFTPEQYGGGKDKACQVLETAKQKFDAFVPASEISPDWGEDLLMQVFPECTKTTGGNSPGKEE